MSAMISRLFKPKELDGVKEQARIERGQRAKRLLDDEAFQDAFSEIEQFYMTAWRNSDGLDVERRERCHIAVCLLSDLKNQLISCVKDGAAARELIERSLR